MKATFENRTLEFIDIPKVSDLLQKLVLEPGAVLVVREGRLLREEDPLANEDEVLILRVISGG